MLNSNHIPALAAYDWIKDKHFSGGEYLGHVFLFLLGFGLCVSGGVTLIAYTNFLPAGITWTEYGLFIMGRIECYFFPLGLILMTVAVVLYPGESSNVRE